MRRPFCGHVVIDTIESRRPQLFASARAAVTALLKPSGRLAALGQGSRHETGMPHVDTVGRERNLRWFALVGLAWRTLATMVALAGTMSWLRMRPQLLFASIVVMAGNVCLVIIVARRNAVPLLQSWIFFAIDVGVAAGLILWTSSVIPNRSLYLPYHELFNPYVGATVMLWTGLRGARVGFLMLLCAAVPIQWSMALLNGFALDAPNWPAIVDGDLWLLASFVIAAIIASLAREAAWASAAAGLQAGREAERANVLRSLHDTVLQTLEAIALQASASDVPAEDRTRRIRAAALEQATELRTVLREDTECPQGNLVAGLHALAREFLSHRLKVEFVTSQFSLDPSSLAAQALLGATREALTNVVKHAEVNSAVVRAGARQKGIRITIRDQGRGFDVESTTNGYGLAHSVIQRVQEVGGSAQVWSAPGRGTRVTLWVPR
jgi:signal transduction histidine kinase